MILLDPHARPVIGHRGASGSFPENTLLAFRTALDEGADALELDVRTTADGVPVVMHDATVDRTTDGSGAVADLPVAEVQRLDAGQGEAVPTLAGLLETVPRIPLIVEVKTAEAVEAVANVVVRSGARDRVLTGSFDHGVVMDLRRRGLMTLASRRQTALFWSGARLPLLPIRVRARAFSVPEHSDRVHVVDGKFLAAARRRGLPVHVWTVDRPDVAGRLWTSGVSGIISNWPGRIVSARTRFEAN